MIERVKFSWANSEKKWRVEWEGRVDYYRRCMLWGPWVTSTEDDVAKLIGLKVIMLYNDGRMVMTANG